MPHIGGDFTNASATLKTYYGTTAAGWKMEKDKLLLDVEVPTNAYATVFIPADDAGDITENNTALSTLKEIKVIGKEDGYIKVEIGSGSYHFAVAKKDNADSNINLADYTGVYKATGGMEKEVAIKLQDNKLVAQLRVNSGVLDPVKNEKDKFTSADGSPVIFTRNEAGKVVKIKMSSLGISFEAVKQ
jgi:alpha-L-rhamnosidase